MTGTIDTSLRNSSYTPEDNRRFLVLLSTFQEFLEQRNFEILYSERLGRFLVLALEKIFWQDEPVYEIESPDHLFRTFMESVAAELAAPRLENETAQSPPEFDARELQEMRSQIMEYLDRMTDDALMGYYIAQLNGFVAEHTARVGAQRRRLRRWSRLGKKLSIN